jgi:peptidoglycan hydrolase-like protein with peptidoglycan-binding domain
VSGITFRSDLGFAWSTIMTALADFTDRYIKPVTGIQKALKNLGYDPGVVDGTMAPSTQDAIRRFQQDHGLAMDGSLTPQTQAAIAKALQGQMAGAGETPAVNGNGKVPSPASNGKAVPRADDTGTGAGTGTDTDGAGTPPHDGCGTVSEEDVKKHLEKLAEPYKKALATYKGDDLASLKSQMNVIKALFAKKDWTGADTALDELESFLTIEIDPPANQAGGCGTVSEDDVNKHMEKLAEPYKKALATYKGDDLASLKSQMNVINALIAKKDWTGADTALDLLESFLNIEVSPSDDTDTGGATKPPTQDDTTGKVSEEDVKKHLEKLAEPYKKALATYQGADLASLKSQMDSIRALFDKKDWAGADAALDKLESFLNVEVDTPEDTGGASKPPAQDDSPKTVSEEDVKKHLEKLAEPYKKALATYKDADLASLKSQMDAIRALFDKKDWAGADAALDKLESFLNVEVDTPDGTDAGTGTGAPPHDGCGTVSEEDVKKHLEKLAERYQKALATYKGDDLASLKSQMNVIKALFNKKNWAGADAALDELESFLNVEVDTPDDTGTGGGTDTKPAPQDGTDQSKTGDVHESEPKSKVAPDYGKAHGGVEYRVKNGERWETVAAAHGIDVKALIRFNFNTTVPEEVNWYLRNYTGCDQPSPDGYNWQFSSSANPGIIYLPPAGSGTTAPGGKTQDAKPQDAKPQDGKPQDAKPQDGKPAGGGKTKTYDYDPEVITVGAQQKPLGVITIDRRRVQFWAMTDPAGAIVRSGNGNPRMAALASMNTYGDDVVQSAGTLKQEEAEWRRLVDVVRKAAAQSAVDIKKAEAELPAMRQQRKKDPHFFDGVNGYTKALEHAQGLVGPISAAKEGLNQALQKLRSSELWKEVHEKEAEVKKDEADLTAKEKQIAAEKAQAKAIIDTIFDVATKVAKEDWVGAAGKAINFVVDQAMDAAIDAHYARDLDDLKAKLAKAQTDLQNVTDQALNSDIEAARFGVNEAADRLNIAKNDLNTALAQLRRAQTHATDTLKNANSKSTAAMLTQRVKQKQDVDAARNACEIYVKMAGRFRERAPRVSDQYGIVGSWLDDAAKAEPAVFDRSKPYAKMLERSALSNAVELNNLKDWLPSPQGQCQEALTYLADTSDKGPMYYFERAVEIMNQALVDPS